MRATRNIFFSILEIIIVVLLAIFAVENIRYEPYNFIGNTIPGNVWWTVAGSALLGFLLAVLMLGPGRIAAGWRSRRLGRQGAQSGQELAALREEHARLQAEHAQTMDERDHYRAALGSSIAASESSVAPVSATTPVTTTPAMPPATAPVTSTPPPAPVVNQSAQQPVASDSFVRSAPTVAPQTPATTAPVADQTANEQQVQQAGGGHGILRRLHIGGDGASQDTQQAAPPNEARMPNTPNTPATPLV